MSIIIYGDLFSFPEGSAATNRVYTYAKGFVENGISVHVICFTNDYLLEGTGTVNGIQYYNPYNQKQRNKHFIIRSWQKLLKYYNTYRIVKKINSKDKIIAINSWSNFIITHIFGFLLTRLSAGKLIIECSEHPLRMYKGSFLKKMQGKINFRLETFFSDGVFCISNFLIDFYKSQGIDPKKLFLVPSTVDPERFKASAAKPVPFSYIGYFGSLTFQRDNIDLLIKAFSEFNKKYQDMHLILGGLCTPEEKKNISNLVQQLNLDSKIHLLDFMSREKIIQYIMYADVLVMVRSNDNATQASFPSKLSEFLASSKPVITFNVGEISLYLADGKNAFFVDHGNINQLANKLEYVHNNPKIAYEVGQNGKYLTQTIFNYKYQADRMLEFITS